MDGRLGKSLLLCFTSFLFSVQSKLYTPKSEKYTHLQSKLFFQAPDGESQPSTEVDLFISTEKIMVLNTDLKVF